MSSESAWEEVYVLGHGKPPRPASVEIVGNKAANLVRMAEAGLLVPPAFVLPTTHCRAYLQQGRRLPADFADRLALAIA
jgi:phosphoenolpyruvate synthase/pyruvate phosphate dikinase